MVYGRAITRWLVVASMLAALIAAPAQDASPQRLDVTVKIELPQPAGSSRPRLGIPAAVLWLKPLTPGLSLPVQAPPRNGYTLLQKNKMFIPHLLVVPVGSVVMFPNADPFFHNVFSLFDGQRFDLGLYEAGKTKAVTFSREGVSYIFCDIHSEMSAVVIALATPLYGIADRDGGFHIGAVPSGDYELHLWVEGEQQSVLDRWVRKVRVSPANSNLGTIALGPSPSRQKHENKFGQPYDRDTTPPY
jgi:hypothetical protein